MEEWRRCGDWRWRPNGDLYEFQRVGDGFASFCLDGERLSKSVASYSSVDSPMYEALAHWRSIRRLRGADDMLRVKHEG